MNRLIYLIAVMLGASSAFGSSALKILVLPAPGGCSHVLLMHRLAHEMSLRGHEVLVRNPYPINF